MTTSTLILVLLVLTVAAYQLGRTRSLRVAGGARGARNLHSLPSHYGLLTAIWCGLPALLVVIGWQMLDHRIIAERVVESMSADVQSLSEGELSLVLNDVRNVIAGNVPADAVAPEVAAAAGHWQRLEGLSRTALAVLALCIAVAGGWITMRRITPTMQARNRVEQVVRFALLGCSLVAILTTIGIFLSVLFEALRFFQQVPVIEFLFGTQWSPQTAIRADQVGSSGAFGAVPLFAGTLLISVIAMLVAVPVGLMSAIYLSEYASRRFRAYREAGARDPRGHSDGRLRLLRGADRRAAAARFRREPRARGRVRERAGGAGSSWAS